MGERSEPRERGTRVYFLRKKCTRRLPFTFIYHQYVGYIYSWRIFPSVVNKLCYVKEKTLVVHFGFLGTLLTTETRSHVKRMCDIEPLSWLLRHVPTTGITFFFGYREFLLF